MKPGNLISFWYPSSYEVLVSTRQEGRWARTLGQYRQSSFVFILCRDVHYLYVALYVGMCLYACFAFMWVYRFAWEGSCEFLSFFVVLSWWVFSLLTQYEVFGSDNPILICWGHNRVGLALFALIRLVPFDFFTLFYFLQFSRNKIC